MLSTEVEGERVKYEQLERVVIGEDEERFFQVKAQLPPLEKRELIDFLVKNIDVFAWNTYKALGMDPNFIYHHLNINPSVIPKKQPPRHSSREHSNPIKT